MTPFVTAPCTAPASVMVVFGVLEEPLPPQPASVTATLDETTNIGKRFNLVCVNTAQNRIFSNT